METKIPQRFWDAAKKREKRSSEYEHRYKSGDISALHEFCRLDAFAVKTKWVQDAIQTAVLAGDKGVLNGLFAKHGREPQSPLAAKVQDIVVRTAVNRKARETGLPKKHPEPAIDDAVQGEQTVYDAAYDDMTLTFCRTPKMTPKTLLNRCSLAKKATTDVMIEPVEGGLMFRAAPVLLDVDGMEIVGIIEEFIPADGGAGFSRNITAVYNIPHGSDVTEKLKKAFNPFK